MKAGTIVSMLLVVAISCAMMVAGDTKKPLPIAGIRGEAKGTYTSQVLVVNRQDGQATVSDKTGSITVYGNIPENAQGGEIIIRKEGNTARVISFTPYLIGEAAVLYDVYLENDQIYGKTSKGTVVIQGRKIYGY